MAVLSKCPRQSSRFPLSLHKTYSKQTHLWFCSNTRSKKMNVKTQNFRLGTTISGLKIDPDNSRWSINLKTVPSSRLRTCICKRLMSSDQTGVITDKVTYHKNAMKFLKRSGLKRQYETIKLTLQFSESHEHTLLNLSGQFCCNSNHTQPEWIIRSNHLLLTPSIYSLHHPR